MSGLEDISVRAESRGRSNEAIYNTLPILQEIRHALQRLATSGDTTIIDLTPIPFGPGDRDRLFDFLGRGEMTVTLDALGESLIEETGYPGVWLILHNAGNAEEMVAHIEIARVPSLLPPPREDLEDSLLRLGEKLSMPA